jgi:hypothetical protein
MIECWAIQIEFPAGPVLKVCDNYQEANGLADYARANNLTFGLWKVC